jgi:hypothetical protein
MNRDFPKQLKKLSLIEPDAAFLARSRATILSLERGGKVGVRTYFTAWAVSFALIALIVVGYAFLPLFMPGKSNSLPIASAETLNNELQNMSINIALNEVSYNNQVNQTIDNAITAITSNKAPHLNAEVLQSESSKLATGVSVTSTDQQINDLLNQISQ